MVLRTEIGRHLTDIKFRGRVWEQEHFCLSQVTENVLSHKSHTLNLHNHRSQETGFGHHRSQIIPTSQITEFYFAFSQITYF